MFLLVQAQPGSTAQRPVKQNNVIVIVVVGVTSVTLIRLFRLVNAP